MVLLIEMVIGFAMNVLLNTEEEIINIVLMVLILFKSIKENLNLKKEKTTRKKAKKEKTNKKKAKK